MPTTQADIEHNFLLEVAWPTIIDCLGLELIKFMFECLILGLFELLAHGGIRRHCRRFDPRKWLVLILPKS